MTVSRLALVEQRGWLAGGSGECVSEHDLRIYLERFDVDGGAAASVVVLPCNAGQPAEDPTPC